jgi:hypothetical protein
MGTMSIHIEEELIEPTQTGRMGGTKDSDTSCNTVITVAAKSTAAAVVTWSSSSSNYIVEKQNGDAAVSGETIPGGITEYTLTLTGFKSFNPSQNNQSNTVTFYLHDDSNNLLDSKDYNRLTNGNFC